MTTPVLVFLDSETTSLRPDRRIWELAAIRRRAGALDSTHDVTHVWQIDTEDLDLGNADPNSLKIGGFYERHSPIQPGWPAGKPVHSEKRAMAEIERLTRGAWIIGAVVNFDTEVMAQRMRAHGIAPSWHYHLGDVESMAAGALGLQPPWGFDDLLAKFGLQYDEQDRHTALGDTRMARDLYDAVFSGAHTGRGAVRVPVKTLIDAWNLMAAAAVRQDPVWNETATRWHDENMRDYWKLPKLSLVPAHDEANEPPSPAG